MILIVIHFSILYVNCFLFGIYCGQQRKSLTAQRDMINYCAYDNKLWNFETKILWGLIYKRRQIFSRLQSIWIRWAQLICHTSRCRGLDSAGCQLVLFCLYSYESKPAELLWHLLNFSPAATMSQFGEFLNFCFTSMRFWLDFECNQVYAICDF